jgi:hypothetical protein
MVLWDKLRQASNYLRKLRLSFGPDSYYQYKRGRKHERKQAEHAREDTQDFAERGREVVERGRGYEERYRREREGGITGERTEREEETEPDR